MKANQVARKHGRLPGEVAFDRCFLPLATLFILSIITEFVAWMVRPPYKPESEAQLSAAMLPPAWNVWLPFTVGLLFAVLWLRALISLATAWRDPSSRVLRFSASVLLIPFAIVTCQLLFTPFQ